MRKKTVVSVLRRTKAAGLDVRDANPVLQPQFASADTWCVNRAQLAPQLKKQRCTQVPAFKLLEGRKLCGKKGSHRPQRRQKTLIAVRKDTQEIQ